MNFSLSNPITRKHMSKCQSRRPKECEIKATFQPTILMKHGRIANVSMLFLRLRQIETEKQASLFTGSITRVSLVTAVVYKTNATEPDIILSVNSSATWSWSHLDVEVNNIFLVHVLQSFQHLTHVVNGIVFHQIIFLYNPLE